MLSTFRLSTSLLAFFAFLAVALVAPARAQLNAEEQQIFSLLANASGQRRPSTDLDPILSSVARARARDMAVRGYFSHTNPDGNGANYLVRQAGFPLPAHYDSSPEGNNIESIAAGYASSGEVWEGWINSEGHRRHLLAESSFYEAQTAIGVGYYYDAKSEFRHYWVVLTAPPHNPALVINSPTANARLLVPQATISGSTAGSPQAARVVVRLENSTGIGAFQDAVGTANWTLALSGLTPGVNTVRVRSLDPSGGTLREATRSFRYAVPVPLLVAINGSGSVTTGFLGTSSREAGIRYTVTATPAVGWLFDRWSGNAQATTAAISFTMAEGFALTAHFRVNPFYARRGGYNGLVQAGTAAHATSGFFKASLTQAGTLTGRLTLGGKSHAFSGKFDAAGAAQVTIKRGILLPPLILTLQLDLTNGTDRIAGTVNDGSFTAALSADQALPAGSTHFAASRYTVRLPASVADSPATVPPGDGFCLLVVGKTGAARLVGTLADSRAFTATATISREGRLPVYASLLAGTGSLAGSAIVSGDGVTVEGTAHWSKPERLKDRYFPAAFETRIGIVGARYIAPMAGSPALAVSAAEANSALRLSAGDLDPGVVQPTTLLPNNRVVIPVPVLPKLTLTLTAFTGRFTGLFSHPVTKASHRISGVILQNENAARGFFLGDRQGGAASFVPVD